jgi:cyclase
MAFSRVIPLLQYSRSQLVKTTQFASPRYVGDPINAVKVFNAKEVDEMILLDIDATRDGNGPDFTFISSVVDECFFPLCYGGGIRTIDDMEKLFSLGVEKVAIHDALFTSPELISKAAARFGSQSIVCSLNVMRQNEELTVYRAATEDTISAQPEDFAAQLEAAGAGEILLHAVDRDGTRSGFDLEAVARISNAVSLPVIAAGGAGNRQHLKEALNAGASAVAAGSLFVFHGPHKAVLLSYLPQQVLNSI